MNKGVGQDINRRVDRSRFMNRSVGTSRIVSRGWDMSWRVNRAGAVNKGVDGRVSECCRGAKRSVVVPIG